MTRNVGAEGRVGTVVRRGGVQDVSPRTLWRLPAFFRSSIGKKWLMAVSGMVLLAFVLVHMLGNLKVYLGAEAIDSYARALRTLGGSLVPRTSVLWLVRVVVGSALVVHLYCAYSLTRVNRRARPVRYQSRRDFVAASYASRTVRWSGIIVGLFVVFHLLDFTWGTANPRFVSGNVYRNFITSFRRWPVAIAYIAANAALALHIYHGAWSMFSSLGITNPRFNRWRRTFATGFAVTIGVGNVSFPVLVLAGVIH